MKAFRNRRKTVLAVIMLLVMGILLCSAGSVYAKSKKKKKKVVVKVTIGHATIGEKGKSRGTTPGDQTGKEVCLSGYTYSKGSWSGWTFVARPNDPAAAKRIATEAIKGTKNKNIGYGKDEPQLYDVAEEVGFDLSKVATPCCCDCFGFAQTCGAAAGLEVWPYDLPYDPAFTVFYDPEYTTKPDNLKVGDILVTLTNSKRHVAIVCKVKKVKK